MTDTLLRHLSMLRLIPREPRRKSAQELQQALAELGYEVDLRSVQRDLVKLASAHILPLEGDGAKPQGWYWLKNAAPLDIPAFDPQAALVFYLVEQHIRHLLPVGTITHLVPWFAAARGFVDGSDSHIAGWPGKIRVLPKGPPQRAPDIKPEVETAVYRALLEDKQLALVYRRRTDSTPKEYLLSPLGLVVRDRLSYFVCLHDGQIKQFSLHRIQDATLLEAAAVKPDDFDLDAYIASGEFGWPVSAQSSIKLIADFVPSAAISLEESPLSDDQTVEYIDEYNVRITAIVQDTLELRAWLRSFGDDVEVLKPESLREEFREVSRNLSDYYLDE